MGEGGPKGALAGVVAEHAANGNGLRVAGEGSPRLAGSVGTSARLEAKIRALAAKLKQSKVSLRWLPCPCVHHSSLPLGANLPSTNTYTLCSVGVLHGVQAAGTFLDGGADAVVAELLADAGQLRAVEEEVAGYAEAALARAERLEAENAELRKAAGDAELDKWVGMAPRESKYMDWLGKLPLKLCFQIHSHVPCSSFTCNQDVGCPGPGAFLPEPEPAHASKRAARTV